MQYKMVTAQDGIIWVTLQPLMLEVRQILDNAKNLSTKGMDEDEIRGIDFTILTLEGVYNFLNALLAEQQVQEMIEKENNK
jgi:hypothetical protein